MGQLEIVVLLTRLSHIEAATRRARREEVVEILRLHAQIMQCMKVRQNCMFLMVRH